LVPPDPITGVRRKVVASRGMNARIESLVTIEISKQIGITSKESR
jgi:hypothetical protein